MENARPALPICKTVFLFASLRHLCDRDFKVHFKCKSEAFMFLLDIAYLGFLIPLILVFRHASSHCLELEIHYYGNY